MRSASRTVRLTRDEPDPNSKPPRRGNRMSEEEEGMRSISPSAATRECRHYARRGESLETSSTIEIVDRQFDFVRCVLPYNYAYTSNSQQWAEAERICLALEGPMSAKGIVQVRVGPLTEAASPAVAISESDQAQRSEPDQSLPGPDQQSEPYAVAVATPMSQTATPSMVERVGRAVSDERDAIIRQNGACYTAGDYAVQRIGRAAIEAMREPTREMVLAGNTHLYQRAPAVFAAMITAALSDLPVGPRTEGEMVEDVQTVAISMVERVSAPGTEADADAVCGAAANQQAPASAATVAVSRGAR